VCAEYSGSRPWQISTYNNENENENEKKKVHRKRK
jgi:hypothetical protein